MYIELQVVLADDHYISVLHLKYKLFNYTSVSHYLDDPFTFAAAVKRDVVITNTRVETEEFARNRQ